MGGAEIDTFQQAHKIHILSPYKFGFKKCILPTGLIYSQLKK